MADLPVFFSWSGGFSHEVARVFREWFPTVLPNVKPWISSDNIDKGKPWFQSIVAQLGKSPNCLLFITDQNLRSEWLYYEAGAIAIAMEDPRICPYLLNVEPKNLYGTPLAQYQCTKYEEEDTWRLLRDLNNSLGRPHNETMLRDSFLLKWPDLKKRIDEIVQKREQERTQQEPPPQASSNHATQLSPHAERILLAASQDPQGALHMGKTNHGFYLTVGRADIAPRSSARDEAFYKSAVNELLQLNMLLVRGEKADTFALTRKGYEHADHLQAQKQQNVALDDNDFLSILETWMGKRSDNESYITLSDVDEQLTLPAGTARRLLAKAAEHWGYVVDREGATTIKFITKSAKARRNDKPW